jgi:enamine deaminase RidA (YjgF/YER057c/UK114 family)
LNQLRRDSGIPCESASRAFSITHFERDFDGFNAVYHRYFADKEHVPSRTTIGVAKLGRGALVEVDLVLYRRAAK